MKKTLALVLSLILVVCMAVPAFAAEIDVTPTYELDLKGKKDVLAGLPAFIVSQQTTKSAAILTDNVYVAEVSSTADHLGTEVFTNFKSHKDASKAKADEASGGTYQFAEVAGNYLYYIEIKDIKNARVDEFALYFTTNAASQANNYEAPYHHIDAAFDILVSCDGGKTYQVAWESVDFVLDSGAVKAAAGLTTAEGGNATLTTVKGGVESNNYTLYTSRCISGKFNQTYENVTNVVYASKALRRNSGKPTDATNWAVRMSEFDVYEAAPAPVTADTTVYFVAVAAVVAGAALTIAVRKKEN